VGAFRAYHLARNRRALTVVMFHRVLSRSDARFAYCDREYTIEAGLFERCLEFFEKHYHVIGVEQLLDGPWTKLPDHPLLITFDDGWADHEQVALPILAKRRLPALAFIAADAVDNPEPTPFWETRLIHAFHRGVLSPDALAAVWRAAGPGEPPSFASLKGVDALIARLDALPPHDIPALIAPLEGALGSPDRHMLTHAELLNLPAGRMAIGGHGASHQPIARTVDAAADLRRSQADLAKRTGQPVRTMSYPHGSYDGQSVAAARGAGFDLQFTSDRVLNPIPREGPPPTVLGRVGLDEQQMTDASGTFREDVLANFMWRPRIVRLDGERPLSARHG
jgi:peptidoglycan/xylan/chitin deacetylase (PgdA/CDA1 family)